MPAIHASAPERLSSGKSPHVSPPQSLHHPGQCLGVSRRGQQVDVVGHQHVTMDGNIMRARGIAQAIEIKAVVLRRCEDPRAIVSALDEVQDGTGIVETWLAGHTARCPNSPSPGSSERRL